MAYLITARKWRPRKFDEVLAQEHITTTLKNAILAERVAQCYLFCGPRGVGKTTTARILAKAVNCPHRSGADPCDACSSCRSIAAGTSMNVLEIDGASNNSVDDVRELREVVGYASTEGRYKIYVIDEVHMLSTAAFNALLKTLEEPPAHVLFIFATTEVQAVPETILSRCQRFNFRRIPAGQIAAHLHQIAVAEEIAAEEEALFLIASRAEGALRDAESMFDQVVSFAPQAVSVDAVRQVLGVVDRGVYFALTEALGEAAPQRVLEIVAEVLDAGLEIEEFVHGLVEHVRHLLFVRVQDSAARLEVADSERVRYEQAAAAFAEEDLLRMLQALMEMEIRRSVQPRFRVELTLVRLASMGRTVDLGRLLSRLKVLEEAFPTPAGSGGGRRAAPASTTPPPTTGQVSSAPAAPPPAGPAALPPSTKGAAGALPQGELNLEKIKQGWEELVQDVRNFQPVLGIFLRGARLLELDGRVLKLSFACEDRFPMGQVIKNRKSLETICARKWGAELRLDCVADERGEGEPPQAADGGQVDPMVKSVLDAFDGELV